MPAPVNSANLRLVEAKDSMKKASTPEPFSTSRTSNWVARGGGLPPYIQHIAHDLVEKRGKTVSNAIQMAIGIVRNWAAGKGNVDANTRAAAAKAVAQWSELKAKAAGKRAAKTAKSIAEAEHLERLIALEEHAEGWADLLTVEEAAGCAAVLTYAYTLEEGIFDKALHPRARGGKFARKAAALKVGRDTMPIGNGVVVQKHGQPDDNDPAKMVYHVGGSLSMRGDRSGSGAVRIVGTDELERRLRETHPREMAGH